MTIAHSDLRMASRFTGDSVGSGLQVSLVHQGVPTYHRQWCSAPLCPAECDGARNRMVTTPGYPKARNSHEPDPAAHPGERTLQ